MYGFIITYIELYDTRQNSMSHWKARIWLIVAFKKIPDTPTRRTHWSRAQFQKGQPISCMLFPT